MKTTSTIAVCALLVAAAACGKGSATHTSPRAEAPTPSGGDVTGSAQVALPISVTMLHELQGNAAKETEMHAFPFALPSPSPVHFRATPLPTSENVVSPCDRLQAQRRVLLATIAGLQPTDMDTLYETGADLELVDIHIHSECSL